MPIAPTTQGPALPVVEYDVTNNLVVSTTNSGSTQSSALTQGIVYEIAPTVNVWMAYGSNPTAAVATQGSSYIAAGDRKHFFVRQSSYKFAFRNVSDATGAVSLTPINET